MKFCTSCGNKFEDEDIDIKSSDIVDLYGEGKIIGDTYKLLESEILKKRLKNKKSEILKYLEKRK